MASDQRGTEVCTVYPITGIRLKGLSHLVQSCFSYRSCMSKDSARSTGHAGHFFLKKYCVVCKKSTLKVLINFGFMTYFEDSHYILLFRYIYGAQLIQWFCYSKHLHVNCCSYINEVSEVLQRHYLLSAILLTSLSIFAQLPTLRSNIFSTKIGTAGVLGNT